MPTIIARLPIDVAMCKLKVLLIRNHLWEAADKLRSKLKLKWKHTLKNSQAVCRAIELKPA